MQLTKTTLAHDALQQSGPGTRLGLPERRVLILADGKRSLNDMVAMLGPDSLALITRLLQDGYLDDAGKQPPAAASSRTPPPSGVAGALTGLLRATTEAVQARTDALRAGQPRTEPTAQQAAPAVATPAPTRVTPPPAPPRPAATAGRQRRSLVAAKMYMVDMLQLQRHADAVDLKARIQCCNDPDALLTLVVEAAQALRRLTSDSFGERIVARLREVLPEEALPVLEDAMRPAAAGTVDALPRIRLVGS